MNTDFVLDGVVREVVLVSGLTFSEVFVDL